MIPTKLMMRDDDTGELRPMTNVEAAPLIACLRAGATYKEIDAETYMLLAWICLMWERTGKIPKGPLPRIVMPTDAPAKTATVEPFTPDEAAEIIASAPGQIAPVDATPSPRRRTGVFGEPVTLLAGLHEDEGELP